jgi:hypothetical protein
MEKKIYIIARNGRERELKTYGGLVRTGGEHCKKGKDANCDGCEDYLC